MFLQVQIHTETATHSHSLTLALIVHDTLTTTNLFFLRRVFAISPHREYNVTMRDFNIPFLNVQCLGMYIFLFFLFLPINLRFKNISKQI